LNVRDQDLRPDVVKSLSNHDDNDHIEC
jgi:hypothetical protein